MFVGFDVHIDDMDTFNSYYRYGIELFESQKKQISVGLSHFIKPDGSLDEQAIEEMWFPKIDAQVFLSHSHKDESDIISISGWLWHNFKIKSFIDSGVWGYSDELLKKIDKRYCVSSRRSDGSIKTYSYELRNVSTSNVHMILSTALMKMIDNTECLMFINTPSSVKWSDITGETATHSPWIYNELLLSKLIRNRSRMVHREDIMATSMLFEHADSMDVPNIEYVIDTKHLINVYDNDFAILLETIEDDRQSGKDHDAYSVLDEFYEQNGIDLEEGNLYIG